MLQIGICDDDVLFCSQLENNLLNEDTCIGVDVFYTVEALCQQLSQSAYYDLLFLDIEFASSDGIRAGQYIRDILKNDFMQIVFVSSKTSYAMDLFRLRPMNFLIKPVKSEDIIRLVQKTREITSKLKKIFSFKNGHLNTQFMLKEILYFSSSARQVVIHLREQSVTLYEQLDRIQEQVGPEFLRIHKSYLVSLAHIRQYFYDRVELTNAEVLPISRSQRNEIRKKLTWEIDLS